ncbi:hypothetical protein [Pseudonocardia ammonioxydans]|uniref:hypothetical protein n=1 Tax=Pseudonocardia ammonioxydans TaxID=260086 RepID=UPI0011609DB6|nr:hypothetical protein [Pseudonocardia ammonioxydans]
MKAVKAPDVKVQVDVDRASLKRAEADVTAAAKRIEAARETEIKSSEKVRLAESKLAEARSKFAADSSKVIAAENALNSARRESVRAQSAVSMATADHERAVTRVSEATDRLERSTRRAANPLARLQLTLRAANGEFDRMQKRSANVASGMVRLAATSLAAGSAVSTLAGTAGGVVALGGAVVAASGAAAVLPGVLAGVVASVGVAKIGFSGLSDAVKNGGEDLDKLAPSARRAAEALRGLAPEWDKLRRSVQDRMFRGVDGDIRSLASKSLPMLRRQLPEIAAGWNDAFRGVLQYLAQKEPLRQVGSILNNTANFTKSLGEAFAPAVAGLLGFSTIGSEYLPAIGRYIREGSESFAAFVNSAEGTAKIRGWIDGGITALRQLGELLGNVGGIIATVFRSINAHGATTVQTMIDVTAQFRDFLNSARGQEVLTTLFTNLRGLLDNLRPGLDAVGRVVGHLVMQVAPLLPSLGKAISGVALAAEPLVRVLVTLATSVLGPILSLVGQFPTVFVGAALAVGGLAAAIKLLVAYAAFRAWLTGIIGLLSSTGLAGAAAAAGGALRGFGGALLAAATGPIGLSLIALGSLVAAIKLTSVSTNDAAAAMRQGGAAAEEMRVKVAAQTSQVGDGLVPAIDRAAASFDNWIKSEVLGIATTDSVNRQIAEQDRVTGQLALAYTYADQKLAAWRTAVDQFGANSPQAILANQQYQTSVDNLKTAQSQAGQATDGHTQALQRQANQFLSSIDADIAWKTAVDQSTAAVAQNGRTVDINTVAGRNNMTQLQALTRAALTDIQAKKDHGASTQEITRLTNAHREQLIRTAEQMGMSREEARRYVDQLNLTPGDVNTQFHTPGLAGAISSVKELNELIGGLKGDVSFNVGQANLPRNMPRLPGRAEGGPIYGPGTSTSDSILARLSDGEFVVRAAAVKQLGLPALHAINAGVLPTAAFARGGVVNGSRTYNFEEVNKQLKALKDEWFPPLPPGVVMMGGNGTGDQLSNARIIAAVARQMGFGRNGLIVALATALQESGLRNINYGDRDSVGLFQQRTSQGWGSIAQIMNPGYSASKFFQALRGVRGWERMPVTVAAQRVQRSAFPNAYAKWVGLASRLASQVGFKAGGVIPGRVTGRDDRLVLAGAGERILSHAQTESFDRLVRALTSPSAAVSQVQRGRDLAGVGAGARKVVHYNQNNTFTETVQADHAINRMTFLAGAP